jgi:hypothetical protein
MMAAIAKVFQYTDSFLRGVSIKPPSLTKWDVSAGGNPP